MGQPKRRTTKVGMGAGRGASEIRRTTDPPLPLRDTLLAQAIVASPEESKTGQRRRLTLPVGAPTEAAPEPAAEKITVRQETFHEVAQVHANAPPSDPPQSITERRSKPEREALRIDQVDRLRSKRISVRGVVEPQPRVLDAKRIARAPLDARDGFILQLIDGKTTMSELVDASGIAADELERIVTRLVRLGIVAF